MQYHQNEIAEDNLVFGPLVFGPVTAACVKIARLFVDERVSTLTEHHPDDVFTVEFGGMLLGQTARRDSTVQEYVHHDGTVYTELSFLYIDPDNNEGETCLNTVYFAYHDITVKVTYVEGVEGCVMPRIKRDVFAFMHRQNDIPGREYDGTLIDAENIFKLRTTHRNETVIQFVTSTLFGRKFVACIIAQSGLNWGLGDESPAPGISKLLVKSGDYYMIRLCVKDTLRFVHQNIHSVMHIDSVSGAIQYHVLDNADDEYGDLTIHVADQQNLGYHIHSTYVRCCVEFYIYKLTCDLVQGVLIPAKGAGAETGAGIRHIYVVRGDRRKRCVEDIDLVPH